MIIELQHIHFQMLYLNLILKPDTDMKIDLKGKNALVCGASKGIGRSIANTLAESGANVTIVARNEDQLKTVMQSLQTDVGQQHNYEVLDFQDTEATKKRLSSLKNDYHILINNTGGPKSGKVSDAQPEDFDLAFKMHLQTSHLFAKHVVPFMQETGFGRIINIISTSVKIPIEGLGVSNTVRGAMASWSKTLSNELGGYGITVNNILPGFADTDRLRELIAARAKAADVAESVIEEKMKSSVPAGRFATPEEIASVVCFLASPFAAYVNGTSIRIDGGKTGSI